MKKETQILLGVGALAVVGYFVWKSSKKTTPIVPPLETPKVFPKDAVVQSLIADVDKLISSNEDDMAVWGDLYHELYRNAELDVNGSQLSAKESINVSKDVQTKAIEYLQKISDFTSFDFSDQKY